MTDLRTRAVTTLRAPARGIFDGKSGGHVQRMMSAKDWAKVSREGWMNLAEWRGLDPTAKATGIVDVGGEPGGSLAIDGVAVGSTPLAVRRPIGRHFVEVSRAGFDPMRRWIEVGAETEPLRPALRPIADADPATLTEELEARVRERRAQIRGCYERRLKFVHDLQGTVALRLKVNATGAVAGVTVEESTLDDGDVQACLKNEAMKWKFDHGKNATVVYPFAFKPEE